MTNQRREADKRAAAEAGSDTTAGAFKSVRGHKAEEPARGPRRQQAAKAGSGAVPEAVTGTEGAAPEGAAPETATQEAQVLDAAGVQLAEGTEVLAALQRSVQDLRRQIEALAEAARSDGEFDETAAAKHLRGLRSLVADCARAETFLNESRHKQAGIGRGGYALDLERARSDIGCKLDRLRRCCGSA